MTSLETQLRSWTPRRPSAGLERRLFGRAVAAPRASTHLGWLAPATACLLFAFVLVHQPGSGKPSRASQDGPLAAAILSNPGMAGNLTACLTGGQYRVEAAEWTNGSIATSSNRAFAPPGRND